MLPSLNHDRSTEAANAADPSGFSRVARQRRARFEAEANKHQQPDTGVQFIGSHEAGLATFLRRRLEEGHPPGEGARGGERRKSSPPGSSHGKHPPIRPARSSDSATLSRAACSGDSARGVQFLAPTRRKRDGHDHQATPRQTGPRRNMEGSSPVQSESSLPQLPKLGNNPQTKSGRHILKAGDPSSKFIIIGARHQHVSVHEIKNLRLYFDSIDADGNGCVQFSKLQAGLGIFSQKTNMNGGAKLLHKRGSMSMRVKEGLFSFTDVLRILYPDATNKNIADLVLISRKERGEKLEARQYPKNKQNEAEQAFFSFCDDKGKADLDQLETFMHENFPDMDQYKALSLMPIDTLDELYDGDSVDMEVFKLWYLKLDEMYAGEEYLVATGRSRRPRRKSNGPEQKHISHNDVLHSYISKRSTAHMM